MSSVSKQLIKCGSPVLSLIVSCIFLLNQVCQYNQTSPEEPATVFCFFLFFFLPDTFFGLKTAEVYPPLGLASDLKPQCIISGPDSLWQ